MTTKSTSSPVRNSQKASHGAIEHLAEDEAVEAEGEGFD